MLNSLGRYDYTYRADDFEYLCTYIVYLNIYWDNLEEYLHKLTNAL